MIWNEKRHTQKFFTQHQNRKKNYLQSAWILCSNWILLSFLKLFSRVFKKNMFNSNFNIQQNTRDFLSLEILIFFTFFLLFLSFPFLYVIFIYKFKKSFSTFSFINYLIFLIYSRAVKIYKKSSFFFKKIEDR